MRNISARLSAERIKLQACQVMRVWARCAQLGPGAEPLALSAAGGRKLRLSEGYFEFNVALRIL
jgi:hypothetical protein